MRLMFKLVFKRGQETVAEVQGHEIDSDNVTVADMQRVIETEQFLEKLTGLRVHIEQVK